MSHPKESTPNIWSLLQPVRQYGPVWVYMAGPVEAGGSADNVWVYHWHTPDICRHCLKPSEPDGDHSCTCPMSDTECTEHVSLDRWQLSKCGLHTVVQVEPLTLIASLGCDEGCPSHGWITNGEWVQA